MITKNTPCFLCGSDLSDFFCEKNNYKLYRCKNCKLIFISPVPDPSRVYDKSYFSGAEKGFGYVDYDSDKEPMIPVFENYLDILKRLGVSSGKFLDIGSATGFFMNLAKKRGFDVYGVEVSEFAGSVGRKNGLNIFTGTLEEAKFPNENFDVISMCDVLEHVPNPQNTMQEVNRILKKGGLIIINTPDAESLWAKTMGSKWHLILPPEHINYFSPSNVVKFLLPKNFEVEVNTKIGKKFTFKYIFNMLYKWQKLSVWRALSDFFSRGFLSKLYIPINLRDNFFMALRKK